MGEPTVCSETCVGRIRYLGVLLYDADRIQEAASVPAEKDLYQAHLDIFLDPNDPKVIEAARKEGIPDSWLEAAVNSPTYKLAIDWKLALPLHPEYRTLPMVWYVPPLSPIQSAAERGRVGMNGELPDVGSLRIPVPVSYTHLDVYKRQNLYKKFTSLGPLLDKQGNGCLLYTSRCV